MAKDRVRPPAGAIAPATILERKRKLDGTVREFPTELLHRGPGVIVVRYRIPDRPPGAPAFATPMEIPAGTVSDGWFWERRPYNIYRFLAPGGIAIAHRFDAVARVHIEPDSVTYDDLVLDWWALPDGSLIEEDRDEFQEAREAGLLSGADLARAGAAARQVTSRFRHIIDELVVLERRWALPHP